MKAIIIGLILIFLSVTAYDQWVEMDKYRLVSISNSMIESYDRGDHDPVIQGLLDLDTEKNLNAEIHYNASSFFYIYHTQLTIDHDMSKQDIYERIIYHARAAVEVDPNEVLYQRDLAMSLMIPFLSFQFREVEFDRDAALDAFHVLRGSGADGVWAESYILKIISITHPKPEEK